MVRWQISYSSWSPFNRLAALVIRKVKSSYREQYINSRKILDINILDLLILYELTEPFKGNWIKMIMKKWKISVKPYDLPITKSEHRKGYISQPWPCKKNERKMNKPHIFKSNKTIQTKQTNKKTLFKPDLGYSEVY